MNERTDELDSIKVNFCFAKDSIKNENTSTDWKKIFAKSISYDPKYTNNY